MITVRHILKDGREVAGVNNHIVTMDDAKPLYDALIHKGTKGSNKDGRYNKSSKSNPR